MTTIQFKRGDSFDYVTTIPATFADGYFVGWTVAAQVRDPASGTLIADLTCAWVDPATTRSLQLLKLDTSDWPIQTLDFDVQFTRTSDGYKISTATASILVGKDVTQ